jgi:hypothetical protein
MDRARAAEDAAIARFHEEERRNAIREARRKQRQRAGETRQQILDAEDAEDAANGWTRTTDEMLTCVQGEEAIKRRAKLQQAIDGATTAQERQALQRLQ